LSVVQLHGFGRSFTTKKGVNSGNRIRLTGPDVTRESFRELLLLLEPWMRRKRIDSKARTHDEDLLQARRPGSAGMGRKRFV
jgi:hypothetical protein